MDLNSYSNTEPVQQLHGPSVLMQDQLATRGAATAMISN